MTEQGPPMTAPVLYSDFDAKACEFIRAYLVEREADRAEH